jgi:AcrR family transcriptional regulator
MPLTREQIISAAVQLIEREGAEAVSMRRIAAVLDCGVMSLYNHVPGKAAVLDGVAEHVMSAIPDAGSAAGGWQEQVRAQAGAFRQIARAYPRCTMVVVSRPNTSAAALRPIERALATLRGAGFDGAESVQIVRMFVAYILGCLLREVGVAPATAPDGERPGQQQLDRAQFPEVTRLAGQLMQRDHDADFEFGLDVLISAVSALQPD